MTSSTPITERHYVVPLVLKNLSPYTKLGSSLLVMSIIDVRFAQRLWVGSPMAGISNVRL